MGEHVRLLQEALRSAGYDVGAIDGIYGPRTAAAVVAFQRTEGLPEDGLVGLETWQTVARRTPQGKKLAGQRFSGLLHGATGGDDVRQVQEALLAEGFDPGDIDAVYGVKTARALAAFQERGGLSSTGVVDEATLNALLSSTRGAQPSAVEPAELGDGTGTLLDRPAREDELGRLAFARALVLRIRAVRDAYRAPGETAAWKPPEDGKRGPFMLHLHGAWGSGKSSLLGFIARELREPKLAGPDGREPVEWVVVEFNAWQHQRIAPPWWWLLSAVYVQGKSSLWQPKRKRRWLIFQLSDLRWRVRHSWPSLVGIVIGLGAMALAGWGIWSIATTTHSGFGAGLKAIAAAASSIAVVIGLVLTTFGITRGLRDWLLVRSAAGARDGLAHAHDPLVTVKSRFEHVVRALAQPIAVIIDDLDRCQPRFVVELLEGIQTLYGDASVTYIVAADGRWIRDCFEEEYKTFLDMPSELGRPLGYHFIEKTFQLSADVPQLTDRLRRTYFQGLLGVATKQTDTPAAEAAIRTRTASAGTEEELRAAVTSARTQGEEAAAVDEALLRAQSDAIRQHTEHRLQNFDQLLEPNPRAMKRLVNAYGLARDVELIESGAQVATDTNAIEQLALWTILRLRWPLLAQHLERHPSDIDAILTRKVTKQIPTDLEEIFADPDVAAVVNGHTVNSHLDHEALDRIIRTSPFQRRTASEPSLETTSK
jgi:peptidoglycan hydrolase-like protein with peptidoglycan-binding domain